MKTTYMLTKSVNRDNNYSRDEYPNKSQNYNRPPVNHSPAPRETGYKNPSQGRLPDYEPDYVRQSSPGHPGRPHYDDGYQRTKSSYNEPPNTRNSKNYNHSQSYNQSPYDHR